MCLLVESIKIQNRSPQNIEGHNARLNKSRQRLFGFSDKIDLRDFLKIPNELNDGLYKCRVIYTGAIKKIEFIPYQPRIVKSLELVEENNIEYEYKYLDRSCIDRLKNLSKADDILIVKEKYITDASSANVVFSDGVSCVTPALPLLKGTKRQLLLDIGKIREEEIKISDIRYFKKAILINAMLDFDINKFITMENIFRR